MSPATAHLPGTLGAIAPFVVHHGYLALVALVLLENVGLPVPGEAVLVVAALFSADGRLSLPVVVGLATVAATAGSTIGYLIGRLGGRPLVLRAGRRLHLTEQRLDRLERFLDRRGVPALAAGRFLPLLRHGAGLAAGTVRMAPGLFLAGTAAGALVWSAVWGVVGHAGASHPAAVDRALRTVGPALLALLGVAVVVAWLRAWAARPVAVDAPADRGVE